MIRSCITDPSVARPRVDEIRSIIANFDSFPQSLEFPVKEYGVHDGYARWSKSYDGPNPAIEREQPIVHAMLAELPVGVALDAACGTGRHAGKLYELGHQVIGVDTTEEMLAMARAKLPKVDFRAGRLEELPVDDASVDLVTCSLALTHVPDLGPVMREFARVLRPGGRAVLSDIHPWMASTGAVAAFPRDDGKPGVPFVVNIVHQVSDYIAAFHDAGLAIEGCLEPAVNEEVIARFPSYPAIPDATRAAWLGLPYLLIWRLKRL
jgi:ubiquinone/menaquinone biosynthesis C-methylase UbiE